MSPAERSARPRALVTGGAGFVGSHLVDRLIDEGHDVLVIDDLSSGRAGNVPPAARVERADIASADLDGLFRSFRPATVYHLAAQASVPASMADPLRDLAVNVVGTHRVAAAARAGGSGRIVFVSSGGAVYGETKRAATERAIPAPASYYGIHKLAAEGHVAQAGLPYAIARPSNIYGPRQSAGLEGAVVASFLAQAAADGTLRIHGDGLQTRDLVHVSDVVAGLLLLTRPDVGSGVWNIGTGSAVSIGGLADLIESACGRPLARVFGPRRPGDVADSNISARRLRALGWRRDVSLGDGIRDLLATDPAADLTGDVAHGHQGPLPNRSTEMRR